MLGTTKDTPIEAMRYMLDVPSVSDQYKVAQIKEYLRAAETPKNPLHVASKAPKGDRLQRGKFWMGQAEDSIKQVCELSKLKRVQEWTEIPRKPSISVRSTSQNTWAGIVENGLREAQTQK